MAKPSESADYRALAEVAREKAKTLPPHKKYELLKALNEGNLGKVNRLIGPR